MSSKQVIVVRKDLNMRKGKMIAQGAHASLSVVMSMLHSTERTIFDEWWVSGQTKICVGVNSEQELLDVYENATSAGIPCSLITDAGRTEFNGEPTRTAAAIGPAENSVVDLITGKLTLL